MLLLFVALIHIGTPRPLQIQLNGIIGQNDFQPDFPSPIGSYGNPTAGKRDLEPWQIGRQPQIGRQAQIGDEFENFEIDDEYLNYF